MNHRTDDTARGPAPVVLPILPVSSLERATALHEALGLDVARYDDGYAWVRWGGHEIWHLRVVADVDPSTNPTSLYVFVDDPESVHAALTDAGLAPTGITDTPWSTREFSVHDPDGNLIRLGCPT